MAVTRHSAQAAVKLKKVRSFILFIFFFFEVRGTPMLCSCVLKYEI